VTQVYGTHGVRLVERGWSAAIPLIPCEKRPSINGWEKYNTAVVSLEQAECWARIFPDHGIGHAAGHGLVGIDLDTDLKKQAVKSKYIADACLGATPMIRVGRAPRVMRYYRIAGQHRNPVATRSFHLFAIYATTGQTAWYGTHPSTRKPYTWAEASPIDIGPNDLPTVTRANLQSFVQEMSSTFPAPLGSDRRAHDISASSALAGGGITASIMREMAFSSCTPPMQIALARVASAPVGTRHSTMVGAVVALVHAGFGDQEIGDAITVAHVKSVDGDRPADQTARVVQNAIQWARDRIGASLENLDKDLNVSDWSIWS
jgi:hypothetical protein